MRRTVAEKIVLREIGKRILTNPAWTEAVYASALAAHCKAERELPSAIKNLETALANVNQKIKRLLDLVETGDAPPEMNARLHERRSEKQEFERQLEQLQSRDDLRMAEPTRDWIDQQFLNLGQVLTCGGPSAALALRALVGGVIWVREIELPHSDRKRLQARFTIRMPDLSNVLIGSSDESSVVWDGAVPIQDEEIVVDLREPDVVEQIGAQVNDLWNQGLMMKEIAMLVGRNRNLVKDALLLYCATHGLPTPNTQETKGRRQSPTLAEVLLDRIMELWHGDMPHGEIAAQCDCDMSIVTTAVKLWHEQRNLPVPDGRNRRKMLRERAEASETDASNLTSSETPQASRGEGNSVREREDFDPPWDTGAPDAGA